MKPVFYSAPIILPHASKANDPEIRAGIEQFCRRAAELWRAAGLISAVEPGLLTASDKNAARRRGLAAGRRVIKDSSFGKARILFLRALTEDGWIADQRTISALASRIWLLDDRCGLANSYLRAVADIALQQNAECILCPSAMRRDQLEAVFLPSSEAAFLSANTIKKPCDVSCHRVHLDRIPDPARKLALKSILNENRKMTDLLTQRAAAQLKNAAILCDLKANTCTSANLPI